MSVTIREELHQQIDLLPDHIVEKIANFTRLISTEPNKISEYTNWQDEDRQKFSLLMKSTTIKTSFDCFAFKQYSQEKMDEETKNFSYLEEVEYLKKRINESDLKVWWESINNK